MQSIPIPGAAAIEEMVSACVSLGRQRIGALIVIERETGLQEYADKGVRLDATLTRQLLINIFFKNSPLHDGAVIVRADRIVAARCIMPLSEGELPGSFGTRHRAALGISEESDAVAVIVSEQTGGISLSHDGQIDRDLTGDQLRASLLALLEPPDPGRTYPPPGSAPTATGVRDGAAAAQQISASVSASGSSRGALFAIMLAILLWGWVTTQDDPEIERPFTAITPAIINKADNLVILDEAKIPSITVTVRGPRSELNRLTTLDLPVEIDLGEIKSPTSTNIEVRARVVGHRGVRVTGTAPETVAISTDLLVSKTFTIEIEKGQPILPYSVGNVDPNPKQIEVRGPQSQINQIARVVLPVSLGDRRDNFEAQFTPEARDTSGTRINGVTLEPGQRHRHGDGRADRAHGQYRPQYPGDARRWLPCGQSTGSARHRSPSMARPISWRS